MRPRNPTKPFCMGHFRRGSAVAGARLAAWLFVASGVIGLANDLIPGTLGQGNLLAVLLDCGNIGVGIFAWLAPWDRWRPSALLALPLLALANLSLNLVNGLLPESTRGVWLVLVFVWIGQSQPPRASLAMGPVAALAYSLPFAFGVRLTTSGVTGVAVSVPVAVMVGVTIARKEVASQRAEQGQREALAILAAANLTDALTGVGNRRSADLLLNSLAPGDALAILDLDHFKQVNDRLGHLAGDDVLSALGQYLRDLVRDGDAVARFGGEEFVVLLRAAGSSGRATIQRLLDGWRQTSPSTTLSAGLAVHQAGDEPASTFSKADAALYSAKLAGRDRLVAHDHDRNAPTFVAV
jgi:diguanylate cyclase (GGDEF)-like protein